MKQNNKLNVSIGTTAFNEEQNIKCFLDSVCMQIEETVIIKEIIVISDGSTDRTAEIIRRYQDGRIKKHIREKRLGMTARLNELFKLFTGDVLVIFDADVILKDNQIIERFVRKFKTDKKIGLVGGNPQPLPAQTFIETGINNFLNAREGLKKTYNFANSAHAAHGRVLAFSRRFAKNLTFPPNLLADDGFSYLACKANGFKFHYEGDVVVWFRSPQTIKDYIGQAIRFIAGKPQLYEYFNQALVDKGYRVPMSIKIKIMLYQLMKNPLGYVVLKALNFYCLWQSKSYSAKLNVKWSTIKSSKKLLKPNRVNR